MGGPQEHNGDQSVTLTKKTTECDVGILFFCTPKYNFCLEMETTGTLCLVMNRKED